MAEGQQIGEAFIRIRPKSDGFEADAQRQIEDPLKRIAKGAAAAFATIAVGGFLKGGIDELGEAQKAAAQTTAALKSTGGQANVTADDIDTLATSLANLSGADKEVVQTGANLLLTFRNVRNEVGAGNDIYSQALTLAQDLSVAYGQDLTSSTLTLGKALDNPLQGLTALQRVGVTFSAQQKDQIRGFVEAGDVMSAQKVILEELTKQVGGSAEAFGDTLPGKLQRAQNAFDDLKGEVVAGAAPALEGLLDIVRPVVDVFSGLPAPVQTGALALGALALVAPKVVDGVGAIGGVVASARDGLDTLALKAMYAKDGLSGAGQAVAGLGSTLTLSNPILLASAAAITTLAAVWVKSQSDAAAAEAAAKDYTAAIEDQTGAVEANVDAAARKRFADNAVGKLLASTSANFDIFTKGIQENEDALDAWAETASGSKVSGGYKNFEQGLRDAADGGNVLAAELIRLRDAREISSKDLASVVVQLEKESNAYDSGTEAAARNERVIGDTADTTDRAATAADDLATANEAAAAAFQLEQQAAKDAADALDRVLQATDDLFGAQLSAEEAAIATREAMQRYVDTLRDGTKTSDERRQAGIDLLQQMQAEAESAANAAQKQAELSGQQFDAGDAAAIQKQKLEELAGTLAPGSPLRADLQGFIDQLQAVIDRKDIQVKVQAIAPGAVPQPAGMSAQDYYLYILGESGLLARGIDGGWYRTDTMERVRATGGSARKGTEYQVAEPGYGPEMYTEGGRTWLIPGADGMVTNARDTAAAMSGGGGFTINGGVTIVSPDPEKAGRSFLRAARREAAFAGGA